MKNKEITMSFSTTSVMAFLTAATEADLKRLEKCIKEVRKINKGGKN